MKNIYYAIALLLLVASAYFCYQWLIAEPSNKEPLPALLSVLGTIIITFVGWKYNEKSKILVKNVRDSLVDIDGVSNTDISVSDIEDKSKILMNKGEKNIK